jgi:hypothetical protein
MVGTTSEGATMTDGDLVLELAAQNLAVRGELRGRAFELAVEQVVRIVLRLRDGPDD